MQRKPYTAACAVMMSAVTLSIVALATAGQATAPVPLQARLGHMLMIGDTGCTVTPSQDADAENRQVTNVTKTECPGTVIDTKTTFTDMTNCDDPDLQVIPGDQLGELIFVMTQNCEEGDSGRLDIGYQQSVNGPGTSFSSRAWAAGGQRERR